MTVVEQLKEKRMSNIGDKFEIEIDSEFVDENNNKLYRIKGFNSLVFDENELNKLKKIGSAVAPIKTVKASELPKDTKVICWDVDEKDNYIRHFAELHNKYLYAYGYGCTSEDDADIVLWEHMTLEDGTTVLHE